MTRQDHFRPRVTPWHIDDSEYYELDSRRDQLSFLIRYAVLAPSSHNTQPWSFRITDDGIEIFADYTRRMMIVDPTDRELFLSLGAAITNLRVAAANFGFETSVLYDRRQGELLPVALVTFRETCAPDATLARLFGAIRHRHTNRGEFKRSPLDGSDLAQICALVTEHEEFLKLIPASEQKSVVALIEEAGRKQLARPAVRSELADWLRPTDDFSDGVQTDSLGIPGPVAPFASWLVRNLDLGPIEARRDRDRADKAPLMLLVTADDDRVSLIRAGEVLELLLLTITHLGLAYSFLNQPVEIESMRERLWSLANPRLAPQLLLRVGYGPPVTRATPRRKVEMVLA
jgi:hypothetical protein